MRIEIRETPWLATSSSAIPRKIGSSQTLANDLKSVGVNVWFDQWEMTVGDSLNSKVQAGISETAWLCVVLSPDSVRSSWVQKELNAALAEELERRAVFVLPLLYKECDVPLFLKDKLYADFRHKYQDGLAALLGRVKPLLDSRLLDLLLSNDEEVARKAYADIAPSARAVYRAVVADRLGDPSPAVRRASLTAMLVMRDKQLPSKLVAAASDTTSSVRRHAVFLLGRLRARYALNVIAERVSDASPDVRATAREAYKRITGRSP